MTKITPVEIPYIEWELLKTPLEFSSLTDRGELPKGITNVKAFRNEDYRVKLELTGSLQRPPRDIVSTLPGTVISGFSFKAQHFGREIIAEGVFTGNESWSGTGNLIVDGSCQKVSVNYQSSPVKHTAVYFISATELPLQLLRWTKRSIKQSYTKTRDTETFEIPLVTTTMAGHDYISIKNSQFALSYCLLDRAYHPQWSRCCMFEFAGQQLSDEALAKTIDVISFLLGKRLIKVGAASFTGDWKTVSSSAYSPASINMRHECSLPELTPIPINTTGDEYVKLISSLSERLVLKYTELNFHNAMSLFWMALMMPSENEIVIFDTVLTVLRKAWFASKQSIMVGENWTTI